jgi:tRNA/tmRNA/rRNA uracil-C5-methylase (TrmA/RlmC/RlmD family)
VADLFAGVGPFALRLAQRARVVAADADEAAIGALNRAAAGASGLKPIRAERRDLFRRPLMAKELAGLDAVVFDPPRQGAEAQARELANCGVATIIAVSCSTGLSRDMKLLTAWVPQLLSHQSTVPLFRQEDRLHGWAVVRHAPSTWSGPREPGSAPQTGPILKNAIK